MDWFDKEGSMKFRYNVITFIMASFFGALLVLPLTATAAILDGPSSGTWPGTDFEYWTTDITKNLTCDEIGCTGGQSLWKDEVGSGDGDSTYPDLFSIVYSGPVGDENGFTLTFNADNEYGFDSIVPLYLIVKDGYAADPSQYIFDISTWNPSLDDEITLSGIWEDAPGSISHAEVCGTTVPIPASAWLLASGLVGLSGLRRKFKK